MRTHQEIDQRSLEMHKLICTKIRANPHLFVLVHDTLKRWSVIVSANSQPYIAEWQRLVDAGLETCLQAAVEDSERGAELRQSSPFTRILTNQERFGFLKNFSSHNAAQRS
jgi:hypothetical protein